MPQYCRLLQAAALSRWFLKALAALALLSWSSDHLPRALALCAALLRRIPGVLFHPASAFLIGNVIVVTLFAKSGGHSSEAPSSTLPPGPSDSGDAHDQRRCYSYFSSSIPPHLHCGKDEEEVVVCEDKAVCVESINHPTYVFPTAYNSVTTAGATSTRKGSQNCLPLPRTRSSCLPVADGKVGIRETLLRRSETDVGARRSLAERWWWPGEEEVEGEVGGRKTGLPEDDNEEFRQRIEAFISKQLRFIEREEESLLLTTNGALVVAAGGPGHPRRR